MILWELPDIFKTPVFENACELQLSFFEEVLQVKTKSQYFAKILTAF